MKVYIPTTILNLGEILSTDSISPASFYKNRGFGSPHWCSVEESGTENAILLYKKCFYFSRPKSDLEDRPMLICLDLKEELPSWQDGVLYSDHTLYFDWNTRFFFFSEEDRQVAISLSQISESTKMLGLYQEKRMEVLQDELETFSISVESREIPFNATEIEKDYKLNKIKGIIYGYYIGQILSATLQDIRDLRYERYFYSRLTSLIASYAPIKKENLELVESFKKEAKNGITKQEEKIRQQRVPLIIENHELGVINQEIVSIVNANLKDKSELELLLSWFNTTLCKKEWGLCVNAVKMDLANELTDVAKAFYKENWNLSDTRKFLNNLRRHIAAGEQFSQEWTNGLLPSLAAFLLRGDDWEDMLRYMQDRDMYDYRLAFAFYGAYFGFASMPKSLTNCIFEQEKEYIGKFYGEVYKLLFGEEIPKVVIENKPIHSDLWEHKIRSVIKGMKKINKEEVVMKSLEETFAENGGKRDIDSFLTLLSKKEGCSKRTNFWKELHAHLSPNLFNLQK